MKINHPTTLFDALQQVCPYPKGMMEVPVQIEGRAFFPGGRGFWKQRGEDPQSGLPKHPVMILGQDFDTVEGYEESQKRGKESLVGTWSNLLKLLSQVPIAKTECFFTNAFPRL